MLFMKVARFEENAETLKVLLILKSSSYFEFIVRTPNFSVGMLI